MYVRQHGLGLDVSVSSDIYVSCPRRYFPPNCGSHINTRKCGNYSDVLPLKAARRDSISNLTSFGASNLSCRRTQSRFIQSRCGAPRYCRIDGVRWTGTYDIVRVGKNSGPVLSRLCRLWTKVHGIFGQRRRSSCFLTPLPACLCHVSFCRYSPLSLEVV